jgi:hypothetical protein
MGDVYHKIDPSQPITCQSCQLYPESKGRIYQCPSRQQGMILYLQTDLGDFLQANHTCPELAHILLDALHCEVYGQHPAFQRRHGIHEAKFSNLLQAQTNLGWSQLLQGQLANDWSRLQDEFLEENKCDLEVDRRYYTGDIWARKLVSHLWGAMKDQWDLHNGDRHGNTTEARQSVVAVCKVVMASMRCWVYVRCLPTLFRSHQQVRRR